MLKVENNLKLVSWQKDQPTEREPPPLASKEKAELVEDRIVASGQLLRYLGRELRVKEAQARR
jgi:hypothetical protein